ncbi:MAG: hypothetical protein IPQ07_05560 [Myxococcales bacterium]|nr:hypothetical protein [Myxococcales bacterium]
MRTLLVGLVMLGSACTGGSPGGGDDGSGADAGVTPDGSGMQATCPLPSTTADLGNLTALKAQRCGVPQSGGAKWYRLSATMASGDVVQLELWPSSGAFTGAVTTGTFAVETDYNTCGICVRAVGDKGTATAKEYFGTGGMVNITAVGANGAPISATITNATLAEVETVNHTKVAGGCTAAINRVQVSGTVMDVGGTGGGGGGGGGGGAQCAPGVGD